MKWKKNARSTCLFVFSIFCFFILLSSIACAKKYLYGCGKRHPDKSCSNLITFAHTLRPTSNQADVLRRRFSLVIINIVLSLIWLVLTHSLDFVSFTLFSLSLSLSPFLLSSPSNPLTNKSSLFVRNYINIFPLLGFGIQSHPVILFWYLLLPQINFIFRSIVFLFAHFNASTLFCLGRKVSMSSSLCV